MPFFIGAHDSRLCAFELGNFFADGIINLLLMTIEHEKRRERFDQIDEKGDEHIREREKDEVDDNGYQQNSAQKQNERRDWHRPQILLRLAIDLIDRSFVFFKIVGHKFLGGGAFAVKSRIIFSRVYFLMTRITSPGALSVPRESTARM